VVHPDLRLAESGCVIEPISSFWDLLLHHSIIIFVLTPGMSGFEKPQLFKIHLNALVGYLLFQYIS